MELSGRSADRLARLLRWITAIAVVLLAILMAAIWVFASPTALRADFAASDCRRVSLRDDVTGNLIVGAEDMALTLSENEILLTAHDRQDLAAPSGGLYSISVFALETQDVSVTARRLYGGDDADQAFRPHGMALSSDGTRIALVNRPVVGTAEVLIGPVDDQAWAPEQRLTGERLCRANDLEFSGEADGMLNITLDRSDCLSSIRDLLPGAGTGRLARFDGAGLTDTIDGLAFPNGIAAGYVAETRRRSIRTPDGGYLRVPGGPDNLNIDQDGWIVAALHPKLVHLWLYREGWRNNAPSRIVRVDPSDEEVRVLYDDVEGALFSGATSAIYGDGLLVLGSAYDEGLLVCQQGLQ
ncbi:MAG: hypothetical protein AB8B85_11335 [Paracoccaceae bacterium]